MGFKLLETNGENECIFLMIAYFFIQNFKVWGLYFEYVQLSHAKVTFKQILNVKLCQQKV